MCTSTGAGTCACNCTLASVGECSRWNVQPFGGRRGALGSFSTRALRLRPATRASTDVRRDRSGMSFASLANTATLQSKHTWWGGRRSRRAQSVSEDVPTAKRRRNSAFHILFCLDGTQTGQRLTQNDKGACNWCTCTCCGCHVTRCVKITTKNCRVRQGGSTAGYGRGVQSADHFVCAARPLAGGYTSAGVQQNRRFATV